MNYKVVKGIIIKLKNEDLELRDKLIASGELGKGYTEEMEDLHNKNAERLNEIINRIGYPTIEKVGVEANEAAWLIIQHSIGQPKFMKKCLKLLEEDSDEHKANEIKIAYLTDRIMVFENKRQLYGTQFDWDENGELSPNLFDDISKVNQRRHSIGLIPLEEQTLLMRAQAREEREIPPKNFEKRKKAMDEWKRKKGWIK